MRPLSFTKNLGGFSKAYDAIRRGYSPGVTVKQFRERCGLNANGSLLVAEFFLFTQVRSGQELVVNDTLITQTFIRPTFDLTLARLYFFALNLAMPGERLSAEQCEAGQLQKHVITQHVYFGDAWVHDRFDKDSSLEPFVHSAGVFPSLRKWVTNYWFMKEQCKFVIRPDGTVETFSDTWGPLALRLFFDRYATLHPTDDVGDARDLVSWLGHQAAPAATDGLVAGGIRLRVWAERNVGSAHSAGRRSIHPRQPLVSAGLDRGGADQGRLRDLLGRALVGRAVGQRRAAALPHPAGGSGSVQHLVERSAMIPGNFLLSRGVQLGQRRV